MAVTENSRDLPSAALIAPHNYKISHALAVACFELAKAMYALCKGAEVLDRKNSQAARNKLATEFAACVFLSIGTHVLTHPSNATCVVIKLNIGREITGVFLKLFWGAAIVERVEYGGIKCRDSIKQSVRGLVGFGLCA